MMEEPDRLISYKTTIDRLSKGSDRKGLEAIVQEIDGQIKDIGYRDLARAIALAELQGRAQAFLDQIPALRIVEADFKIVSQQLLHFFDFNRFKARVLDLFVWFAKDEIMLTYMAPYFPLVQSSGMGKTKLLWELYQFICFNDRNSPSPEFEDCVCAVVLCVKGEPKESIGKDKAFTHVLNAPASTNNDDAVDVFNQLDAIVKDIVEGRGRMNVVLLLDEMQHLLENGGFGFRAVRWWLQRKDRPYHVVAVFTGTTTKLTHVFMDPPTSSTTSRQGTPMYYHKCGTSLYEPFFSLCTVGLFAHKSKRKPASEFEVAVPYGRPLFALLQDDGKLDDAAELAVLSRMLLNETAAVWSSKLTSCLSILGTRIQMGHTSVQLASDLVAKGYAVLSHFRAPTIKEQDGMACMYFPTDPVCARLAMALMDESWAVLDGLHKEIRGRDKTFWMSQLSKIITLGLCHPPQGGVGELLAASYLLFCGDVIRRHIDKTYRNFSVPLGIYFACLLEPPDKLQNLLMEPQAPDQSVEPQAPDQSIESQALNTCVYKSAHVNFIQFTRNYIRFSVEHFFNEGLLRDMYRSGSACITFPGYTGFDMVASIKLSAGKNVENFVPMLVSVSTVKDIGMQLDWFDRLYGRMGGRNIMTTDDIPKVLGPKENDAKKKGKGVNRATTTDNIPPPGPVDNDDAKQAATEGPEEMDATKAAIKDHAKKAAKGGTRRKGSKKAAKTEAIPQHGPEDTATKKKSRKATKRYTIKGPNGKGFVGIRLLFDRSEGGYKGSIDRLTMDDVKSLLAGEIVWKVVIIPRNDPFGIIDVLACQANATLLGSYDTEIYSSHSYLFNFGLEEVSSTSLVKDGTSRETTDYLDAMREALLNSRVLSHQEQENPI